MIALLFGGCFGSCEVFMDDVKLCREICGARPIHRITHYECECEVTKEKP